MNPKLNYVYKETDNNGFFLFKTFLYKNETKCNDLFSSEGRGLINGWVWDQVFDDLPMEELDLVEFCPSEEFNMINYPEYFL